MMGSIFRRWLDLLPPKAGAPTVTGSAWSLSAVDNGLGAAMMATSFGKGAGMPQSLDRTSLLNAGTKLWRKRQHHAQNSTQAFVSFTTV
jgi:hypothetical protein